MACQFCGYSQRGVACLAQRPTCGACCAARTKGLAGQSWAARIPYDTFLCGGSTAAPPSMTHALASDSPRRRLLSQHLHAPCPPLPLPLPLPQASDFASKVDQLTGMGFPLALAAGALGRAAGDVEAATETCLAVTG